MIMHTPTYDGGDRRHARRTLSQAAAVMLRLDHEIGAIKVPPGTMEAAVLLADWRAGRWVLAAQLIAGKYLMDWEALALG